MYEGKFFESFSILEDRRVQVKVLHKLLDIVFIVIAAVICGCNEWKDIKLWMDMELNQLWLRKYIRLQNGLPSLSTIGRLFNIINPKQFEKCFSLWMGQAIELDDYDIISIDGKTSRGSIDEESRGIHIVSAICRSRSLVIGQVKTNEKSNEITAIPDLLDMLVIKGCTVTIDAMGCQKKIVEKIVNGCKADYVLNVKANQESLLNDIVEHFQNHEMVNKRENLNIAHQLTKNKKDPIGDSSLSMLRTIEKGHGRIESRTYYYSQDIQWMLDARKEWIGLKGVGMVLREVEVGNNKSSEYAYFIGSVNTVKQMEKAVRNHWQVESFHWSLDVTYRDDAN